MTLDKTRELLRRQVDFGGFYNGDSAELILSEARRKRGQAAVDQPVRGLNLEQIFGFKPGTGFKGGLPPGQDTLSRYREN